MLTPFFLGKVERRRIIAAKERSNPSLIELEFELEANSNNQVYFQVEKAFLHWTEFPPDAHRGFDIPSSLLLYHSSLNSSNSEKDQLDNEGNEGREELRVSEKRLKLVYSESLLVTLPSPDFSMPYNVIMLVSTVFGFFFGSLIGNLTLDFSPLKEGKQLVSKRLTSKLFAFIMNKIDGK